jgi:hypothetical protein
VKIPTLAECEKAIGEPASSWTARCYEISCKIVKAGLVSRKRGLGGEAVYGHWLGPVSPRSHFADRKRTLPFIPHGWIWVESHSMVIDPTRWVFEAHTPYLFADYETDETTVRCKHCQMLQCEHDFLGANDECILFEPERWPYDEGGNAWRAAIHIHRPAPEPKAKDKRFKLKLSKDVAILVGGLLGQRDSTKATAEQIFWLSNLPYQQIAGGIGPRAVKEVYDAICDAGSYYIEFIPLDNRVKAKREAGFSRT